VKKAITDGFQTTDTVIVEESNKRGWMNGSTAVVGVLVDHTLYIANIGDSEAVLVRQNEAGALECEAMTVPHKASDPNEKRRIEALGGHVFFGRVFGALAVSRSFGDSKFKTPKTSQNFVSWEPAIQTRDIDSSHKFLILACDGLWDVMKHEEAADFVNKQRAQGKNANEVAKALVREALNKRTEDNVTIVLVFFSWSGDSSTPSADTAVVTAKPESPKPEEPAPASNSASEDGAFPATN
jgi:serine/threonine protein phosphatase PrpC